MRRLALLPLGVLIVAALAFAAEASATTPVIVTIPINETFIWDQSAVCGFPVTETITGTVHIEVFFANTGTPVRVIAEEEETGTFTANGLTVSTAGHLVTVRDLVNGTVTVTGVIIHTSLPTGGTLYLDRGRLVFDVNNDTLVFEAGPHPSLHGDFPGLCAALTP